MDKGVVAPSAILEEGRAGEYEMVPKRDQSVRLSPDIEWVNLNMTVGGSKKILSDCWGSVSNVCIHFSQSNII